MPRRIRLHPYLTAQELHQRYRRANDPVERSRWHFLWLLARGLTATAIARVTGYSAYWIGQIARRYNRAGPDAVRDQRRPGRGRQRLLTEEHQAALRKALAEPHSDGERWCGRTVADWLSLQLDQRVSRQAAWRVLRHLGARFLKPRPRHIQADPEAQADFKERLRPLLREVARAFPHATVDLWAVDEHRIGLKPILQKVWSVDGQRPLAPVQHRYEWRYLVGFVHPTSGRTVFHLATSVSIPSSKPNSPRSPKSSAPQRASRSSWCWIVLAGTAPSACVCLTISTCTFCRPILQNSSLLSICGR